MPLTNVFEGTAQQIAEQRKKFARTHLGFIALPPAQGTAENEVVYLKPGYLRWYSLTNPPKESRQEWEASCPWYTVNDEVEQVTLVGETLVYVSYKYSPAIVSVQ